MLNYLLISIPGIKPIRRNLGGSMPLSSQSSQMVPVLNSSLFCPTRGVGLWMAAGEDENVKGEPTAR